MRKFQFWLTSNLKVPTAWMSTLMQSDLRRRVELTITTSNILAASWIVLLWWGESYTYTRAINRCQWHRWEKWVDRLSKYVIWLQSSVSTDPFRIALIADPQLVDENTYERRGILLKLSQFYTDLYMKRNWQFIHSILNPKITIFLGDLMDGGREWEDKV